MKNTLLGTTTPNIIPTPENLLTYVVEQASNVLKRHPNFSFAWADATYHALEGVDIYVYCEVDAEESDVHYHVAINPIEGDRMEAMDYTQAIRKLRGLFTRLHTMVTF